MKIETLLDFLNDNMPSDAIIATDEEGMVIIHTQMRVQEKPDGVYLVSMEDKLPDNVIILEEHPKFRAAHYEETGGFIAPSNLE